MSDILKSHEEKTLVEGQSIENVWKFNCNHEFSRIAEIIEQGFNFIAIDTEFPGVVYTQNNKNDLIDSEYQTVKLNVDRLNLIQIGFSFSNSKGEKPKGTNTWQFNFCFNLQSEIYSEKSIEVLKKAGIKFDYLMEFGIKYALTDVLVQCSE